MARKVAVLFGAGASMDAGLPTAYRLTRQVYERLVQAKSKDAELYAFVVSKLITRNSRNGQSPFGDINIEEVYDGLKRLLNRDKDLLSEFVSGWDPISRPSEPFDAQTFAQNFASAFHLSSRRSLGGGASVSLKVEQSRIRSLTRQLQRAFEGDFDEYRGASLEPFLATLSQILNVDGCDTEYMDKFLRKYANSFECIATLNYDLLVEASLQKNGSKVDLGLSQWNEKRYVRFHGQSPKLIKLHGSTNWYIQNDDEIIVKEGPENLLLPRAMIFGGQSDKLVPYGPFLHLRHQFQQFLQRSTYLLVIGYSFQDLHLNALIRSWIATRNNGKVIIVDPSDFSGDSSVFKYARIRNADRKGRGLRAEIKQIKKGFAQALPEIEEELQKSPVLSLS